MTITSVTFSSVSEIAVPRRSQRSAALKPHVPPPLPSSTRDDRRVVARHAVIGELSRSGSKSWIPSIISHSPRWLRSNIGEQAVRLAGPHHELPWAQAFETHMDPYNFGGYHLFRLRDGHKLVLIKTGGHNPFHSSKLHLYMVLVPPKTVANALIQRRFFRGLATYKAAQWHLADHQNPAYALMSYPGNLNASDFFVGHVRLDSKNPYLTIGPYGGNTKNQLRLLSHALSQIHNPNLT